MSPATPLLTHPTFVTLSPPTKPDASTSGPLHWLLATAWRILPQIPAGLLSSRPSSLCSGVTFSVRLFLTTPRHPPSPYLVLFVSELLTSNALLLLLITASHCQSPPLQCGFSEDRDFSYSLLYPRNLEECFVHQVQELISDPQIDKWGPRPDSMSPCSQHVPRCLRHAGHVCRWCL